MKKFNVSMMCVNYLTLESDFKVLDKHTDLYHMDIMDGHFVPNIALSFDFIKQIRSKTDKPIDTHLMVTNPKQYFKTLYEISDYITIHPDVVKEELMNVIKDIKDNGVKVGFAISPNIELSDYYEFFPYIDKLTIMTVNPGYAGQKMIPSVLDKIAEASSYKKEKGYNFLIDVDGNNNFDTFELYLKRGADIFILGTGLFNSPDLEERFLKIKEFINEKDR